MKYATFIAEVQAGKTLQIPSEVYEKLRIELGDRVEVSLKKIKSSKFDLMLSENPLYRLLDITPDENSEEEK